MPRDWYVNESELDDYQVQIINRRSDRSFIVRGCAGSGKTILALWKAKEIAESGRGSFYVIVFTKALRQFIEDGIREIGLDSDRILYHYEWQIYQHSPSADYIIVDEAQDFTRPQIIELQEKANKAVLFYGDSAQQLYKSLRNEPTVSLEEMSTLTGLPMEQLVFNHRLPKKIARFAQHISNINDDLEGRCRFEGDSLPKIHNYDSTQEQFDKIIQIIQNQTLTDVGILFPHNVDVKEAYNYFRNKEFNIEAKYSISRDENIMTLDFTNDNPKLMTYHSAKGLQFETVFMPNCTEESPRYKNPIYVAITRAYKDVYIMHSDNLSSYFDYVPANLYSSNNGTVNVPEDDLPF